MYVLKPSAPPINQTRSFCHPTRPQVRPRCERRLHFALPIVLLLCSLCLIALQYVSQCALEETTSASGSCDSVVGKGLWCKI